MDYIFHSTNWSTMVYNLVHLSAAFILSLPIACNREKQTRSVGLRTYPLVAIGACAFVLIGTSSFEDQEARARILYGVVTGIGFIGGGAILKEKGQVTGTANAASLWCTGAVGAAVALSRFEVALLLSLIMTLVFTFKEKVTSDE